MTSLGESGSCGVGRRRLVAEEEKKLSPGEGGLRVATWREAGDEEMTSFEAEEVAVGSSAISKNQGKERKEKGKEKKRKEKKNNNNIRNKVRRQEKEVFGGKGRGQGRGQG